MLADIEWVEELSLRDPVAVLAFEGWNDAAEAASRALDYLTQHHDDTLLAQLDLEPYANYQVSRPLVSIDRDHRRIQWPAIGFCGIRLPEHAHDLVLVMGDEPHHRWRAFCSDVIEVLHGLGVQRALSLGAFVGLMPHTLPVPIFGAANDPAFPRRMGINLSSYEGPTGITGAITIALEDEGIEAAGLWAGIPHYLAGNPSPTGTRALLFALGDAIGWRFDVTGLDTEIAGYEAQIDEALADSSELVGHVEQLEREFESRAMRSTGHRLVEDIERFLRNPN